MLGAERHSTIHRQRLGPIAYTVSRDASACERGVPHMIQPEPATQAATVPTVLNHQSQRPFADPRNFNRVFDALCRRAGLRRVRVHDLRHTCASLLHALGVPARDAQEILGHSHISITLGIYTHVANDGPATRNGQDG